MQTETYDQVVSPASLVSPPYPPVEIRLLLHLQITLVELLQIEQ
jgi:hypothetical protein